MPGIVGIVTRMPRPQAEAELARMVAALMHDPSYVTGTEAHEAAGIYVAWIARSATDAAATILRDRHGHIDVLLSAEDLVGGRTCAAPGASESVLARCGAAALIEREQPSFPSGLNGRFHGVCIDRSRGTAMLFNDRYGMHRLYYHPADSGFYFAAEAKAILSVRPELRRTSPRAIGELVTCGAVLGNRSLFEGIDVLPPASCWTFRSGGLERKSVYFERTEWERQAPLDALDYYDELRDVFSRIARRHFEDPRPIGMSLTGGLDTRMIMAWHKPPRGTLPCYSFGGTVRDCEDVILARRLARSRGQPYEVIPVGDAFLSRFAHYAERSVYLADGCTSVAHAPDLYLNERARRIAPVRMTGNYGGEVLRQVRAFKAVSPMQGLFSAQLAPHICNAHETYEGLLRSHPLSFAAFEQAPWHHYGLLALEQTQVSVRSPFLDNDLVRTAFRAPLAASRGDAISLRLIADGDATLLRIPTDRGLAGNRGTLAGALSRGWMRLSSRAEYAYGDGMPPWLARTDRILAPLRLERAFLGRHKFAHFRIWYRDALAGYVRDVLLDARSLARAYLEPRAVRRVVAEHTSGRGNHTAALHRLLTLELVHRLLIDRG